jgi:hypothetical protein
MATMLMLPLVLLPRVRHSFVIALKSLSGVRGQVLQSLLFLLPAGFGSACELAGIVRAREVVVAIVWHVSTIVDVLLGFERPNLCSRSPNFFFGQVRMTQHSSQQNPISESDSAPSAHRSKSSCTTTFLLPLSVSKVTSMVLPFCRRSLIASSKSLQWVEIDFQSSFPCQCTNPHIEFGLLSISVAPIRRRQK